MAQHHCAKSIFLGSQSLDTSGSQNRDLEAKLWSELKLPKIIAQKLFSLGIKIQAVLGARVGVWKLSSGVN